MAGLRLFHQVAATSPIDECRLRSLRDQAPPRKLEAMLLAAAFLVIGIGLVHSYLGEKYILVRLFRQPLPKLFGSDDFTRQTIRFVWHILTVAWFGFAAILVLLHLGEPSKTNLLSIIGATFSVTGLIALLASRGKHLSWIVFSAIAALCFISA